MKIDCEIQRLDVLVDSVSEIRLHVLVNRCVVGVVGLQCRGRVSASFRQLYVHPIFRRLGIARRLIEECCEIARNYACRTIGCYVEKANVEVVLPFYEKVGFVATYEYENGDLVVCRILS
jgi:ribosomal protein S18 acetylase RimI-like enzyme